MERLGYQLIAIVICGFLVILGALVIFDGVPEPQSDVGLFDATFILLGRIAERLGDFWTGMLTVLFGIAGAFGYYHYPRHRDHRSLHYRPYGMFRSESDGGSGDGGDFGGD